MTGRKPDSSNTGSNVKLGLPACPGSPGNSTASHMELMSRGRAATEGSLLASGVKQKVAAWNPKPLFFSLPKTSQEPRKLTACCSLNHRELGSLGSASLRMEARLAISAYAKLEQQIWSKNEQARRKTL